VRENLPDILAQIEVRVYRGGEQPGT